MTEWRDGDSDEARRARERVMRQATLYTYGFLALAVAVALIGAAFLAWVFMAAGLPFYRTWLVLTLVILGVPMLGQGGVWLWKRVRRRTDDEGDDETT